MHLDQVLNPNALPARVSQNEFTPPHSGRIGGSPSLETLYGSVAQPSSSQRTSLDVATRSAQSSRSNTAPFSEAHNHTPRFNQSIESRSHPLPQQPKSLKRQRSLSPAPPGIPVLPGHRPSEPISQGGVSTESIDRTKRYAKLDSRYAPRDERSETDDNLMALKRSEARHVPLRAATGVTSAPRQQNTLNALCDQRGETVQQPASYPRDFRQGAYIQQDRTEDKIPGFSQQSPLAHTHDSASSSSRDTIQATGGHWDHPNTLPPIRTRFELRQNSSTPIRYDRWRWQRQYHHGRNHDNTREQNYYGTYEPHIMENRRFVYEPDGERTLVHETSPTGPPLKPFDPPTTESIALSQQLYVLRKQEAEEYPVADTYQVPLVTNGNTTLI